MPRRKVSQKGFPWHRKFDDCWYVTDPHSGDQRRICDAHGAAIRGKGSEAKAIEVWHQMMALANAPAGSLMSQLKTISEGTGGGATAEPAAGEGE